MEIKAGSINFIDIEDVREGLIVLKGGRYRAAVTADPINFSLLSEEEQEAVEEAFGSMLMGLSFPVQILVCSRPVDMRDSIQALRENLKALPPPMTEYEAGLEKFLGYFAGEINITESHIIVPYDDSRKDYRKARGELMRRVQALLEGLSKCGLIPKMLDTDELLQFLLGFFDKDAKVRVKDLIDAGALELYKEGGVSIEAAYEEREAAAEDGGRQNI